MILSIWNLIAGDVLASVENTIDVPQFLFLRQLFTTAVLFAMSSWTESPSLRSLPTAAILKLILCGVLGIFVISYAYFFGLLLTDPTSMSLFDGPLVPVAVFILALISGSEKFAPTWRGVLLQFTPTVVCASGATAVLVATSRGREEDVGEGYGWMAVGLLCLECFCMAASIVLQRSLTQMIPPFALAAYMYFTGTVCSVLYLGGIRGLNLVEVVVVAFREAMDKPVFGLGLAYSVFLHSAAALVLLSISAKRLEASKGAWILFRFVLRVVSRTSAV